ncbi:uncharacterized protein N7498_003406 [Penicillium cinerascens]|uniref:Uncharacterized protein n=1 Tax=Penicillium cinerascens TaxID=70096 RepID=A0A9W9T7V0_9EURO|nr:uncharacterized protein N7498_003406 [Penicillium cinerascens]KAJ5211760.1 hypothetical protein N7498_003406 [Penicillium cinerascens]
MARSSNAIAGMGWKEISKVQCIRHGLRLSPGSGSPSVEASSIPFRSLEWQIMELFLRESDLLLFPLEPPISGSVDTANTHDDQNQTLTQVQTSDTRMTKA